LRLEADGRQYQLLPKNKQKLMPILTQKHTTLQTFSSSEREGSQVNPYIWSAAIYLIQEKPTLRDFLGKAPRGNFSGAIAYTGVDLSGQPHPYAQVKLLIPEEMPCKDGSIPKYHSPSKHTGKDFDCFLTPGIEHCPELLEQMGITLPENKTFWQHIADHPEIPIILTEGAKKAMCGLSHGLVTIAIPGVWMALRNGQLTPLLEQFAHSDRRWYLAFDADLRENKQVAAAFSVLTNHLINNEGGTVFKVEWPLEQGKGMDDYVVGNGIEEFNRLLALAKEMEADPPPGLFPAPEESEFSYELANLFRHTLVFDSKSDEWMRYSATPNTQGIWTREDKKNIRSVATAIARTRSYKYRSSYIKGVCELLELDLIGGGFKSNFEGYLPCKNGLLNLETKELQKFAPGDRITWKLDVPYDPQACPGPILNWMLDRFGSRELVNLVGAFFSMVLMGHNLQKYLELVGPGATGKSTLIKLLIALVGARNVHTTALEKLSSRFEPANFKGKKLGVIMDADKFLQGTDTLKSLVAMETLPYERKFKDATSGFIPRCGIIVAANQIPQTTDHTSGLRRRRITLFMDKTVREQSQRELIEIHEDGTVTGEFAPYLPGLLNWVLEFTEQDRRNYLKDSDRYVPELYRHQVESLVSTNPIAAWVDECLYLSSEEERTQVGVARKVDGHYENESSWLFPNYKAYCESTGVKPVSQRRFTDALKDLFRNQLKHEGVYHRRDRDGSFFYGIKIRAPGDQNPSPVRVLLESHSIDTLSPPPDNPFSGDSRNGNVMGRDRCCDGSVMSQSLTGYGSDGFESQNSSFLQESEKQNSPIRGGISTKNHLISQDSSQSRSLTDRNPSQEDSNPSQGDNAHGSGTANATANTTANPSQPKVNPNKKRRFSPLSAASALTLENETTLRPGDRVMYIFYGCTDPIEHIYVGSCTEKKWIGRHWLVKPESYTPGMKGSRRDCILGSLANGHKKDGTFWKKD